MSFYDLLAKLNDNLYENPSNFTGFELLDEYHNSSNIDTYLYKYNNKQILAIKGTDFNTIKEGFWDIVADLALTIPKILPKQYKQALTFFKKVYTKDLIITGYSLGGSIAQMLGNYFGNETITFEAFGTGHGEKRNNITNFGLICDPVFIANYKGQVGNNYIIPIQTIPSNIMTCHFPGNYGQPSKAFKFDGNIFELLEKYGLSVKDKVKNYVRKGIIPTKQDKLKSISNTINKR